MNPVDSVALGRGPRRLFRIGLSSQVLTVLCLMYLAMYIDRVNIATVAPRMTADLGLNNTQFGLAISAFSYPYALFQLIGGWVSDRFGPRRALLLSGLVVCVATACTGLVGGLGSLIAARVMLGFGEGSAFPTATRALSVWMPRARWGFAQGITHSASRLGNVLTPPLIAGLMAYTSWRGSFVALGLLSLSWLTLWWWVFRDDPRESPGVFHPLVCTHPQTGRRMLYLGRRRNAYIEHFELADSEALLDTLWSYTDRPEFAWQALWQVGDLVLWDNRCTMHRRDPFDPAARRVMHRTQIKAQARPSE